MNYLIDIRNSSRIRLDCRRQVALIIKAVLEGNYLRTFYPVGILDKFNVKFNRLYHAEILDIC